MNKKKRKLKRLATKNFKHGQGYKGLYNDNYFTTDLIATEPQELNNLKKSLAGIGKSLSMLKAELEVLKNHDH